jgi:hypothetical protein
MSFVGKIAKIVVSECTTVHVTTTTTPFRTNNIESVSIMVAQVEGSPGAAVSYQPPNVESYQVNDEIVRLLAANDPNVAGLTVCVYDVWSMTDADDWAEKIGRAIARSTHLRKLTIEGSLTRCVNLQFFSHVACPQ